MPRVVHFDIHVDDVERAKAFYEGVFGWTITKWDGPVDYWLITTGADDQPGINGGMVRRSTAPPPDDVAPTAYNCVIDVADVDACVAGVERHGGQNVIAKHPIPGVGWIAYCHDTERNRFGVIQMDPTAGA